MDPLLFNQKLQYLTCQKGGLHEGEELNYICLTPNCEQKGIICSICRAEDHQGHHVLTLKNFLNQLQTKITNQNEKVQNADEILQKLEELQSKKLFALKEYVMTISKSIKLLEKNIIEAYQGVRQRVISQSYMSENMPQVLSNIINGEYQDSQVMQKQCLQLLDSISIVNKEINIDLRPDLSLQKFERTETSFVSQMQRMSQQVQSDIEKTVSIIEDSQLKLVQNCQIYQPNLKFSSSKKASFIQVLENGNVAKQTNTNNQDKRIAILEPKLANKGISEFALEVKKYMNWVGIGISMGKTLEKKNYVFTYSELGHGNFFISSNGYVWSSQKKEENSKGKGFTFKEGDIILCQLNLDQKTLKFAKYKDKAKKFQFSNLEIKDADDIYASVNICNANESVKTSEWKKEYSEYFEDTISSSDAASSKKEKLNDILENFSISSKKKFAQNLNEKNQNSLKKSQNMYSLFKNGPI